MSQPPPYDRQFNFQNQALLTPNDPPPADEMDSEYNAIKLTLDATLANLALIQRDDGALKNDSVGLDQLKDEVLTDIQPVLDARDATFAARDTALAAQSGAQASATSAMASENAAETAETNAGLSETAAEVAQSLAEVARAGAQSAEAGAVAVSASLSGTSITSNTIGTGSKSFTTQTLKAFTPGSWLLITSDANPTGDYMHGVSTAYSGTELTIDVQTSNGSGTHTDWSIRVSGLKGASGSGIGDVLGPATNNDSYIPQWNGANSKTLKNGIDPATVVRTTDIGSTVQAFDADLSSIAGLSTTTTGRSILTIADPNADRVVAWDDSAGGMAAIALADLTTEAAPAAGDYVLIYGAEGDLRKTNWNLLPGSAGAVVYNAVQTLTASEQQQARANISAAIKGHIFGLTLSNNGTDPTNDIDIAVGEAASTETNPVLMVLASALTKQLDAAWAVGTNAGGRDTGAIADDIWHVWLIRRSDTGVVDALFSLSATSPTMPTNYDQKRRIGAIVRSGATILLFVQLTNTFYFKDRIEDVDTTISTSRSLLTLSIPPNQEAIIHIGMINGAAGVLAIVQSTFETDAAPNGAAPPGTTIQNTSTTVSSRVDTTVHVDSSSQIAARASAASTTLRIYTRGWKDSLI